MATSEDQMQVFNIKKGIDQYGGDEEMYYDMMYRFEELTLDENLTKLYNSLLKKNWHEVYVCAHSVKGASGYLDAEILYHRAGILEGRSKAREEIKDESQYDPNDLLRMEKEIVEDSLRFIDASIDVKRWIAERKGKDFDPTALEENKREISKVFGVKIPPSRGRDGGYKVDTSNNKSAPCAACKCNIF